MAPPDHTIPSFHMDPFVIKHQGTPVRTERMRILRLLKPVLENFLEREIAKLNEYFKSEREQLQKDLRIWKENFTLYGFAERRQTDVLEVLANVVNRYIEDFSDEDFSDEDLKASWQENEANMEMLKAYQESGTDDSDDEYGAGMEEEKTRELTAQTALKL